MFHRGSTPLQPEKKACQQGTNLPQKQTLPLVRPSFANVNIVNAIFGFAWADEVVMGR